jgi:CO/xanthine dehydrogenase Mo-binding subunit
MARRKGPRSRSAAGGGFVATRVEVEGREEIKIVELPAFEPVPWDAGAALHVVGTRVPRRDALEKITGRATYTADLERPGMLHAAIVRATVARGHVTRLDLAPALAIPGVRDAIADGDAPGIDAASGVPLFGPTVSYAGQPIAAVCADTLDLARRGAAAVVVEYATAPHVVSPEEALSAGSPRVRDKGNIASGRPRVAQRGDVDAALARADVVVRREYRTPVALHTALEPHGAVAEWEGDHLVLWESTQGIFSTRADLAAALELPLNRVRVIHEHMGGGFGAKNGASTNAYVAALLARRTGRPVRCINDREGEQLDSGNRPATIQRVTIAARRDGRLTALVNDAVIPLGIDGWLGGPGKIFHELYSCPNVRTTETFVYTNTGAMSSFRAPGHVEGAFALECALDTLARTIGHDPLELRLINYAERNEEKKREYSSKMLRECYERLRGAGSGVRESPAHPMTTDSAGAPLAPLPAPRARGSGFASQIWSTGGGPPAYALVRLNPDGTVDVVSGTQELGTGSRTVFAQIAAEALGARVEDVRVVLGDTERTPYTGNSWGSMTVPSVGPAVRMAAEDARAQLLQAAAGILQVEPDRLAARDSVVRVARSKRSITFAEIGERIGDVMIIGRGSRGPNPDGITLASFGAQRADVEVDTETGIVRVLRISAVHDVGRVINPTLAESQVEGGILQGVGYALFEERVLDHSLGVPLNPTMHDYKVPTLADAPEIDVTLLDVPDPVANHTGARGLAEPPIIPTAPAIANAVVDAIGAEITELPITPWRVLEAIRRRDASPGSPGTASPSGR